MKVYIPSPLRSYTRNRPEVQAEGLTIEDLLEDLERQFPGIRFRMINEQNGIREHVRIFINGELTQKLSSPLGPDDEVHLICALSGG
jgi:molybdopterin converting factor small subunit